MKVSLDDVTLKRTFAHVSVLSYQPPITMGCLKPEQPDCVRKEWLCILIIRYSDAAWSTRILSFVETAST